MKVLMKFLKVLLVSSEKLVYTASFVRYRTERTYGIDVKTISYTSNKGDAPAKPPQIITTNTLSNIKLPVLQKDDYDTWAMEMEHYLEYIDNEVWKVIQNGNSKKRVTKGKDGVYRVLPPTTQEEQFADEKERKARTLLLMAVPKDHLRRFHAGCAERDLGSHQDKIWCSTVKIGYNDIPLYSRFKQVEYKGVPHPLSGDYTPREQEDIDDSLYEYGKYGPQPQSPSPTVSDASSIVFLICPSNDSDGDLGAQVTIATQKTQPQVPKPKQTVDPSCAQHVKTPRQPIRTPVISSPIPSNNRQNWNQQMERELGAGYSFERKPCFVCGSLSHLIKDCDYYEKKMAREAALKSQRMVHADIQQATPAWTNTNRVNKANKFTPRPVQLSNIRPNLSTASKTIKTGRVNVNTGHGNVNSGSVHINSGTQIKSGPSRFNTGKQHVNSGSVHINSGIQFKSGASRFNTGKQHINSGSVHVNTARVNRPVPNNTSPKPSQVNLKSPKKCFSKQRSPVNRPFSRNTAHKSNKYVVKGKMGTAVKTSAGCVWRKVIPLSNTNSGPTPDSNVNVSRGPQGRPKPVKAWVTRINWRILKNSIGDLLPLEFTMSNRHKDWLVQEQTALGAKGLTSPEQTATGKGISNPLMAVMVCPKPYGIQLTNVSSTEIWKLLLRDVAVSFDSAVHRDHADSFDAAVPSLVSAACCTAAGYFAYCCCLLCSCCSSILLPPADLSRNLELTESTPSLGEDFIPADSLNSIPADYVSAGLVLVPADSDRIC
ncbi:hypothetical protein Tco_0647731 [Tanacetum coccineum]